MKKFMFLSFGILCLSISALIGFHIGNHSAQAQAPEPITGAWKEGSEFWVMLSNGDVYWNYTSGSVFQETTPLYAGNLWGSGPVNSTQTNWGKIKGEYKGK